ncbi:MAG: hypothetical protein JXB05_15150, partial [Myxococcaceae bacterium]|nr:hypothetical protein [Myxococcaceae bacterium]
LHRGRKGPEASEWSQLVITSKPLKLSARTVAGDHPFDLERALLVEMKAKGFEFQVAHLE